MLFGLGCATRDRDYASDGNQGMEGRAEAIAWIGDRGSVALLERKTRSRVGEKNGLNAGVERLFMRVREIFI